MQHCSRRPKSSLLSRRSAKHGQRHGKTTHNMASMHRPTDSHCHYNQHHTSKTSATRENSSDAYLQCRTGHGYAGDFYAKLKPGTDPSCPCGEPSQTRTHILRECHLYKDHRYILRKISPSIYPPDILGTRKGVEALAEFLSKSNAYTRSGTGPST